MKAKYNPSTHSIEGSNLTIFNSIEDVERMMLDIWNNEAEECVMHMPEINGSAVTNMIYRNGVFNGYKLGRKADGFTMEQMEKLYVDTMNSIVIDSSGTFDGLDFYNYIQSLQLIDVEVEETVEDSECPLNYSFNYCDYTELKHEACKICPKFVGKKLKITKIY